MAAPFAQIFIPQAVLEEWSVGENLIVDGDVATLSPGEWRYRLIPALHLQLCATGPDPRGLLGKVQREEALRAAGAEVAGASVVWGDDVYEGVEGFLGERLDAAEDTPAPTPDVGPSHHAPASLIPTRPPA